MTLLYIEVISISYDKKHKEYKKLIRYIKEYFYLHSDTIPNKE